VSRLYADFRTGVDFGFTAFQKGRDPLGSRSVVAAQYTSPHERVP
jgi:hypothetical protein